MYSAARLLRSALRRNPATQYYLVKVLRLGSAVAVWVIAALAIAALFTAEYFAILLKMVFVICHRTMTTFVTAGIGTIRIRFNHVSLAV